MRSVLSKSFEEVSKKRSIKQMISSAPDVLKKGCLRTSFKEHIYALDTKKKGEMLPILYPTFS